MTGLRFHTSPDRWACPKGRSGLTREYVHGKLLPMQEPVARRGLLARIFGRWAGR